MMNIFEHTTKNGVKGIIINLPSSPVFYSTLYFRAGSNYVDDYSNMSQLAHLTEHMMANVKHYKDKGLFDEEFTKNGAYRNASTGSDYMSYVARCANFEWQRILGLQIKMISQPNFSAESLRAEKGNVISEFNRYLDMPIYKLSADLEVAMGNPKALSLADELKTIDNIKLKDIKSFYKKTHSLANMGFVLVGDLKDQTDKIDEIFEKLTLPKGQKLDIVKFKLSKSSPILINQKDLADNKFDLQIVVPNVLPLKEQMVASILNEYLAGDLNAKIYGAVRRKGLAYSFRSYTIIDSSNSYLNLTTSSSAEKLIQIAQIMKTELIKVRQGEIDKSYFNKAKARLRGKILVSFDSRTRMANYINMIYQHSGKVLDIDEICQVIESVKVQEVIDLFREFIDSNCWAFGVCGNTNSATLRKLNDILAPVFAV